MHGSAELSWAFWKSTKGAFYSFPFKQKGLRRTTGATQPLVN